MSTTERRVERINEFPTFTPPVQASIYSPGKSFERDLIAIEIKTKYVFADSQGRIVHEYEIPGSTEIQNCGGYVDKIFKYRDPALLAYLKEAGVSAASFRTERFPILQTRSPQIDLLLLDLIKHVRLRRPAERVSLFDHGCSAAEHFDALDVLLQADMRVSATDLLTYTGLDNSQILLTAAKILHPGTSPEHFRLICREGSKLDFPGNSFDLCVSMGVVNHVGSPMEAIHHLVRGARWAAVLALWVTSEDEGFYAINHSGNAAYFFAKRDLEMVRARNQDSHFLVADFIPEHWSSQRGSYVGISKAQEDSIGCYHLVVTKTGDQPFHFNELAF